MKAEIKDEYKAGLLHTKQLEAVPQKDDIHYSWTGTEWIPCRVWRLSAKCFWCYNSEKQYGTIQGKPFREFVNEKRYEVMNQLLTATT